MTNDKYDEKMRKPDRATRLAEELRANLARRKSQARSRSAGLRPAEPGGDTAPGDDPPEARKKE